MILHFMVLRLPTAGRRTRVVVARAYAIGALTGLVVATALLAGEGEIFIGGGAAKGGIRVHIWAYGMKKPPEIALGGLFGAVLNANQP